MDKRRIAVVTPFLDKRHGTERCVAEQVERWVRDYGHDVHVYTERIADVTAPVRWHRVWIPPGPHLVRYLWWFVANHLVRAWDHVRGLRYDLTYAPGVNCLDADLVSVHIVFAAFYRQVRRELGLRKNPVAQWIRLIHRRCYYRLIMWLEGRIYGGRHARLVAVSHQVGHDLARYYRPNARTPVVYHGVSLSQFNPAVRVALRPAARRALALPTDAFAVLLIGNDFHNKGLHCLLEAIVRVDSSDIRLLVVGRDRTDLARAALARTGLQGRVRFLSTRPDVEFYYAAADCYVAASVQDAFALPVVESMACGLPVIVSRQAGASEIVTDEVDALVLKNPRDPRELAGLLQRLYADKTLRNQLGANAVRTARACTWERNVEAMEAELQDAIEDLH